MEAFQMEKSFHKNLLNDKWVLWAHLPHDTDWTLKSYTNICEVNSVEMVIELVKNLPEELIKNCMLFFMRKGIRPMWEDPKNKKGGCFSFKVNNKNIKNIWKNVSYKLTGESLTKNEELLKSINGITVSPKKSFCILKIWLSSTKYQSISELDEIQDLSFHGCIFKKHKPDF